MKNDRRDISENKFDISYLNVTKIRALITYQQKAFFSFLTIDFPRKEVGPWESSSLRCSQRSFCIEHQLYENCTQDQSATCLTEHVSEMVNEGMHSNAEGKCQNLMSFSILTDHNSELANFFKKNLKGQIIKN